MFPPKSQPNLILKPRQDIKPTFSPTNSNTNKSPSSSNTTSPNKYFDIMAPTHGNTITFPPKNIQNEDIQDSTKASFLTISSLFPKILTSFPRLILLWSNP